MFSNGTDRFFRCVAPGQRPSGKVHFPPGDNDASLRRHQTETARVWLNRCVESRFGGDMSRVAIEENLALFATIHWHEGTLVYANLQALWVSCPLTEFVQDEKAEHRYLRLDLALTEPGPIFKEPIPHIHSATEGEPRFALSSEGRRYPINWFIDFIYRNFYYDLCWNTWVETLWNEHCEQHRRANSWITLQNAFKSGQLSVVASSQELSKDLKDLSALIVQEREKAYPLTMADELLQFG
jgi:hypothetical protein